MRISPVTFFQTRMLPKKPPQRGQVVDSCGNIYCSAATSMYRVDINWKEFANYLSKYFQDAPKVDSYVFGCSDGSEAYSLSILLQASLKNPEKFFPIMARDLDKRLILKDKINQKTGFKINNDELRQIREICEEGGKDAFEFMKTGAKTSRLTRTASAPVEFKASNILDDIDTLEFKNPTLFMCRNMWPYVKKSEYEDFAKKLYDKLPYGSCVVVGFFDYKSKSKGEKEYFPKALENAGFKASDYALPDKNIGNALIFEKKLKPKISYKIDWDDTGNISPNKLKRGQIIGPDGNVLCFGETYMFRNDIDWRKFKQYLNLRFCMEPKINTYIWGCSSGYEPYSLAMLLREGVEDFERFFPIKAMDINEETIRKNVSRGDRMKLPEYEYVQATSKLWEMGFDFEKYFEKEGEKYFINTQNLGAIEFSSSNILDDIDLIDPETPALVLCRNMWPYVNGKEHSKAAQNLYNRLSRGSSVVIGDFDYKGIIRQHDSDKFPQRLHEAGFVNSKLPIGDSRIEERTRLVFEKN